MFQAKYDATANFFSSLIFWQIFTRYKKKNKEEFAFVKSTITQIWLV